MLKQIKEHPIITIFILVLITIAATIIIGGYRLNWAWTGFTGEKETYRTLYDWLQLLIIPFVLAIAALLFNFATTRTEQKIAAQRYDQDQKLALDKQREDLLQIYLDRISELLLNKQLRISEPDSEVRNVARVRTITILYQLDARRIGLVFAFLRESGLMSTNNNENIISMVEANLEHINFSQAWLQKTNLSGAWFAEADFRKTNLDKTDLSRAYLGNANLSGAWLFETNLSDSNLSGANFSGANLARADFSGSNLSDADFSDAFLNESKITDEQLKKVKSLKGATMPDGSKHP